MLSAALIHGSSDGAWKTTPRSGPGPAISLCATTTEPSLIEVSPATIDSTVDLPQPECPRIETNSPSSMRRSKPRTITCGPAGVS